ncbi:E3 ubiquitin-protein ligase RSL1-like [Rosa rugosa]|uniref:E3 ubiquitin-protein ligase RSL1-like n=1 Tax=Rosa rugosa TaxID=74645 RepID=UPI002B401710|nr:E3 ubiquitin-protein ligase RSL1-like [Rosa rugosa]
MTVSIQDKKVKRREAALKRMKNLGDQVVKFCMSIAAKLQGHSKNKPRGSSNQTMDDQNKPRGSSNQTMEDKPRGSSNKTMEDQNKHDDAKTSNTSSLNNKNTSATSTFIFKCQFCHEETPLLNAFHIKGCNHFYCPPCIVKFVVSKLHDDITSIMCPVSYCSTGVLDLEYCRRILPKDVTDRWEKALSENNNNVNNVTTGLPSDKYLNCPFKACAAWLNFAEVRDYLHMMKKGRLLPSGFRSGFSIENKYLCPSCNREFCIKCRVPYHSEFNCFLYQKLKVNGGGEEGMVMYLAGMKQWKRCPCCNYYVIKEDSSCSINYVTCWCGYTFCYYCLLPSGSHQHDKGKCKPIFPA